jgi:hypothetical protein
MKIRYIISAILVAPVVVHAAGCDDYPNSDGMTLDLSGGGMKVMATASSTVSFDDIDAIKDAKDEATLLAKSELAKFMNETIKSDESREKAVNEMKSLSGSGKEAIRVEAKKMLQTLQSSSSALLRGAIPLGDCYTKGQLVRVSVGFKAESLAAAGNMAGDISKSVKSTDNVDSSSNNAPTAAPSAQAEQQPNPSSVAPQGMDGYSNSKGLNNF